MKQNSMYFVTVFLLASLLAATRAIGDETKAPDAKPARTARKLASLSSRSTAKTRVQRGAGAARTMEIRFGALLGVSSITDPESNTEGTRNFLLGLTGDFREYRYFGAELDFFYGLPAKKEATRAEILGGMAVLKGQLPIEWKGLTLTPKVGLGYGIAKISESISEEDLQSEEKASLQGVWAMVGLDTEILGDFIIGVDYARTIDARGKLEAVAAELEDAGQTELTANSAERVRVGFFYRVAPHVILGAQYIRRSFKYEIPVLDGGLAVNPIHNQFMGLVMYEL